MKTMTIEYNVFFISVMYEWFYGLVNILFLIPPKLIMLRFCFNGKTTAFMQPNIHTNICTMISVKNLLHIFTYKQTHPTE
jgi:hypothetical protein